MLIPRIVERKKVEPEKVEQDAKRIMDSFLKELGKTETPEKYGLRKKGSEQQMRKASEEEPNERFRQALFANAPKVKDEELVMERKQW